jgi:hypothetical protein
MIGGANLISDVWFLHLNGPKKAVMMRRLVSKVPRFKFLPRQAFANSCTRCSRKSLEVEFVVGFNVSIREARSAFASSQDSYSNVAG